MKIKLKNLEQIKGEGYAFSLPVSKSLLARRLVLSVLEGQGLSIWGGDELNDFPEDIRYLYQALHDFLDGKTEISVGESGTAMRLMTALLSFKVKKATKLYGLGRQHQRPIAPLVKALRILGAKIDYLDREGYPPLLFYPANVKPQAISLDVSKSSQYLSALLLLAPIIEERDGNFVIDTRNHQIVSAPYAFMTISVLKEAGYYWLEDEGLFMYQGKGKSINKGNIVEADWTSASYAYALCKRLSEDSQILLPKLRSPSLQGDSLYLPKFYQQFGIITEKHPEGILIRKASIINGVNKNDRLNGDFSECPDLVPTFVATCLVHKQAFSFEGVAHLRIKECDRLAVLKRECAKIGVFLNVEGNRISWNGIFSEVPFGEVILNPEGDHRMAMALAPMMAMLIPKGVIVKEAHVVAKSFPNFWDNLSTFAYDIID